MNKKEIIIRTEEYVKRTLKDTESGHGWWHVYRVCQTAIKIGKIEKADLFAIQLAALLHDIADWKFHSGDASVSSKLARNWLEKQKVDEKTIAHVCEIIDNVTFKGAGVKTPMKTKEGRIVQDADRLDAIGAIGVGRAFSYGGSKGREMYDPNIKPKIHQSFEEYKKGLTQTINHFHEKLLLLKDRMNTKTAKKLAEERTRFMKQFLDEFYKEWDGKA